MKYLCCGCPLDDKKSLKNHYADFHNVDGNNHFFRKLFTRQNVFFLRKCFRCDHFCINRRDEKNHIFLLHYQSCGREPAEEKPLKKKHLLMKI